MNLYFRNNPMKKETLVRENVQIEDSIMYAMYDLEKRKPTFDSRYQRVLKKKNGIIIDFGSYDECYILKDA